MTQKKHIYLTGFMGTGKTSTGLVLAGLLRRPFVDLDKKIERIEGLSITDIFSDKGEDYFRTLESDQLSQISHAQPPFVASLGGGIILKEENRTILRQGLWINLNASSATIWNRIAQSTTRPLLGLKPSRDELEQKLLSRQPLYSLAPFQIATDGLSTDAVAKNIVAKLKAKGVIAS